MSPPRSSWFRGAGGRPLAPLLIALLLAGPAASQPPTDAAAALAGGTLRQLAASEDVAPLLRSVVRGRQQVVFEHLRAPQGPVQARDGFAFGWGCEGGDCRTDGMLLGYEPGAGRTWLLLVRDGALDRRVPPRGTAWPVPLVEAVATVRPDLAEQLARGQ